MSSHVLRVRTLYKRILRVHRGLPADLRTLGDAYVKEEFKKHKNANPVQAEIFVRTWTEYYSTLAKQVLKLGPVPAVGKPLAPDQVDWFSDEQLHQLYELQTEAVKPKGHIDGSGT